MRLFPSTFRGQNVVIALAQDITARKQAEAELRLLREAIEQAGEAIVITDPEANIRYANPAFETVTGYSREEIVGKSTRLLNSGQQSPEFYRDLWDTLLSGQTWQGSLVNRRKDGSLYSEEESISPVFDDQGRIVNYVAVKRDVSARLHLEDQLIQARKMESVGRLAGGIAHDFNNMLGIVLGYAELAKRRIEPDNPAQKALDQILLAAERSSDLVRQLLTFARRQPIEPRVLDLNATSRPHGNDAARPPHRGDRARPRPRRRPLERARRPQPDRSDPGQPDRQRARRHRRQRADHGRDPQRRRPAKTTAPRSGAAPARACC